MSVPHALLGLLEERSRHGYDLKREYDRRFGAGRPLRFGQVYSTLGRLHRDGRVTVAGVEVAGGRERTAYATTGDGRADLERWLGESVPPAPYLQSVLFTKVVLALLSGRPATEVLDRRQAVLVLLGVPVLAVATALVALRRVVTSPLGVTRQSRVRRAGAARLLPLAIGLVLLALAGVNARAVTGGRWYGAASLLGERHWC